MPNARRWGLLMFCLLHVFYFMELSARADTAYLFGVNETVWNNTNAQSKIAGYKNWLQKAVALAKQNKY